jgi:hypothetical protein
MAGDRPLTEVHTTHMDMGTNIIGTTIIGIATGITDDVTSQTATDDSAIPNPTQTANAHAARTVLARRERRALRGPRGWEPQARPQQPAHHQRDGRTRK